MSRLIFEARRRLPPPATRKGTINIEAPPELARVIPQGVSKVQGVVRTETLIAFQVYSRHDLDRLFSIGFEASEEAGL